MLFNILSLFPEWFSSPLSVGLMGKARAAGLVDFNFVNPRDFTTDPHRTVDDAPYGGGPGMVMMPGPLAGALRILKRPGRIIALTPAGRPFTQALAADLACESAVTLLCGRYEGFDSRLLDLFPIEPVSVGDFVLNGGEAAALSIVEAVSRLIAGFMGKQASGDEESFSRGLLEYPHFTRPEEFEGLSVPSVLLSGDHGKVAQWRHERSLGTTLALRPDLLEVLALTAADRAYLTGLPRFRPAKNLYVALVHHPVLLKHKISGTTSLTNLDIHDIARSSRSYGAAGFFVATPLDDQRALLKTLLDHWVSGEGGNPDRAEALRLVIPVSSIEEAVEQVAVRGGMAPCLVGSSAKGLLDKKGREIKPAVSFRSVRESLRTGSVLLLLGTGHGLTPEVLSKCDAILPPLRWAGNYNHFPVRAAAAIILDRLLGDLG